MAFSFLMNMFKPDSNPNKVVEVRPEKYSDRTVVSRHDCMILYGVQEEEYEIVLHRPWNSSNSSFSLFRTPNLLEAEETFAVMKHKIPVLVKISREVSSELLTHHKKITVLPTSNIFSDASFTL
ncbi:uncharacterized protein LOC103513750 [Diaphorina citri]|uniref:Uncharacterized protein LOC103513750 n=1 Tax=Diaphorina citri TaxID=121845 RepID=A0A1S3D917_DIACI|nr:uncharacterized protein LOC103513750 [Diaphorina citri]